MSRELKFIGLGAVGLAIGAIWILHASRVQDPDRVTKVGASSASDMVNVKSGAPHATFQPAVIVDPREARKKATDYRQFFQQLMPLANTGSAAAQYELASVLHYCDQNWRKHFFSRSTGALRTPEDMRQLYSKLSESTQSLLEEAERHCRSFVDDLDVLKTSSDWLEQAVKANYPAAIFMKADLQLQAHLIDGDVAALQEARQSAILASASADPAVLFGMADFVDGAGKSREQAGQLMSAWWLLGCEIGYDCSAESDAIRGLCTVDPQCANKPTVIEELQRTNGAKFGEIQQLADQIKAAVESHDPEEIKKFL